MIKDQSGQQQQDAPPPPTTNNASSSGGQNQAPLAGEAPPPAYTPSPYFQGLPLFSNHAIVYTRPATIQEGQARARGRFFKALIIAFLIYLFAGALLGGGLEDERVHRHDAHRPTRPYPPPRITHYEAAVPAATTAPAVVVQQNDEVSSVAEEAAVVCEADDVAPFSAFSC